MRSAVHIYISPNKTICLNVIDPIQNFRLWSSSAERARQAGELLSSNRRKSSLPEQTGLPKVGSDRLVELGEALRAEIADVQNEPIPERLQNLIDALKALEIDESDGGGER